MSCEEDLISAAFVGHVDHGKSSILGRLLVESRTLHDGKLEQLQSYCQNHAKDFEYSYLIDALEKEQSQGVTIDMARIFIRSGGKRFLLIDTPGHLDFIKNMITGSSKADLVFLVIDAKEGIRENTLRHTFLLSFLRIPQIVVLVNKMDQIDYSEEAFNNISNEITQVLQSNQNTPSAIIPLSAKEGDHIILPSPRMPWYQGKSLWNCLLSFTRPENSKEAPLRMPLQDVYRFSKEGDTRRIYCGTLASGCLKKGDQVVFSPSGKGGIIASVESEPEEPTEGFEVGITLTPHLFIERGELMCRKEEAPPQVSSRLSTHLFWLGEAPLISGDSYVLRIHTSQVMCTIEQILCVRSSTDLEPKSNTTVNPYDFVTCVIRTVKPIAFDLSSSHPTLSRFVLSNSIQMLGAGVILAQAPEKPEPVFEKSKGKLRILGFKHFEEASTNAATLIKNQLTQLGHMAYFTRIEEHRLKAEAYSPMLAMCQELGVICLLGIPTQFSDFEEHLRFEFTEIHYVPVTPEEDFESIYSKLLI